jgi:hypothetical protein
MVISSVRLWILISTIVLLSSCGGGSDPAPPNNFSASAIKVETPDPRIAYPLKATISLQADQPMSDVPVSLFAVEKLDDPNAEARQIPLGSVVLAQVNAGTQDYDLEVIVPASVEFAGPYYLSAFVDPANIISESNEDDNSTATEMMLADSGGPNIILTDFALDRTALIINTDDYIAPTASGVYNADAGGTITFGADGLALGESVDIEAFAILRIKRSDNGTSLDMPLYLWNTATGRYTNAYGIDPATSNTVDVEWLPMGQFTPLLAETAGVDAALDDVRRDSEHMEFYFPGKLGSELEQALRYPPQPCTVPPCVANDTQPTVPPPDLTATAISELKNFLNGLPFSGVPGDESAGMAVLDFDICVKIRPTDPMVNDSSVTDNDICPPIKIFLPPLPGQPPVYDDVIVGYPKVFPTPFGPLASSDGFATRNSNPYFAFNIDFGAGASADDRGVIGYVSADLPVQIFGNNFNFMGITVRAQLVPDYVNKPASEKSGFTEEIRFLNQVIDIMPPITPVVSFDFLAPDLLIPDTISKSKEGPKVETTFFVGPVPMVAGATTAINYGFDYGVGYASDAPPVRGGNAVVSFGASIGPFVNLEAGLYVGVGIKGISAGVEGVLTLVDGRLVYFIGTDIEVIDDGFTSGNVEFIITPEQTLSLIFTGPQGALNLFVKYPTFTKATCTAGVVKYRCIRYNEVKRILNLYTTPALFQLEKNFERIERQLFQLDVLRVNGFPTAYYIP